MADVGMLARLQQNAAVTLLVFGFFPFGLAAWQRVRIPVAFGLNAPRWAAWGPTALLIVGLWPMAHELVLVGQWLAPLDERLVSQVHSYVDRLNRIPLPWVLATLSVVPAVAEEWFFRGFVMSGLDMKERPYRAIVWSALAFGVFHVLTPSMLLPERFLGTAFLGMILAWVRWKTGSLIPGMLVHIGHNCLLLTAVRHREYLERFVADASDTDMPHLKWPWIIGSAVVTLAALAWLSSIGRRKSSEADHPPPS